VGFIEVKGAGTMEVWHVLGRRRADASAQYLPLVDEIVSGAMA